MLLEPGVYLCAFFQVGAVSVSGVGGWQAGAFRAGGEQGEGCAQWEAVGGGVEALAILGDEEFQNG